MKISLSKYKYGKWYNYIKPKRICWVGPNPIYKWLFWNFTFTRKEYQEMRVSLGKQTCFVYCPNCDNELDSASFIKDTDFVYYKCVYCNSKSKWDFDAPCPICVDYDGKERKK